MNINREKHLKIVIDELDRAIEGIDRIYDEADNDLKEIIEIAVRWYENKDVKDNPESILYYTFFNDAFHTELGPSYFYGGLGSFLTNCILDDSYYELKWRTLTYDGYPVEGKPWSDAPYVVWANDEHGTKNSAIMLKAMKFAIQQEKEREEWYKEDGEVQS